MKDENKIEEEIFKNESSTEVKKEETKAKNKKEKHLTILPIVLAIVIIFCVIGIPALLIILANSEISEELGEKGFSLRNVFDYLENFNGNGEETYMQAVIPPKDEEKTDIESAKESITEIKSEKESITVGGYTLKFGTYKGQTEIGVWDDETMTSTLEVSDVILKLTENSITIDGQTGSYSINGNSIIWNGDSYLLEVTENNKIRYNVQNCPELTYQY